MFTAYNLKKKGGRGGGGGGKVGGAGGGRWGCKQEACKLQD